MKDDALKTILLRSDFYRDAYRRSLIALFFALLINILLLVVFVYLTLNPTPPEYFAMTPDGHMINVRPLTDPSVTDDFVLQWSANAVRRAYSLDFLHWQEELQQESNYFTPSGWNYFLQQVKSSNNLNTLQQYNMVSTAQITGSPQIGEKAVVSGHYAWKVTMPILISFTNGLRTIRQPAEVTLLVVRMPVQDYPDRIAINNMIVNEQGQAQG